MNYKQIRHAANLSLSEIASFLGVGTRMVRYYESRDRIPSQSVERLYGFVSGKDPAFRSYTNALCDDLTTAYATIDALAKALERSIDLIDGQLVSEAHECMNEAYDQHTRVIQLARGVDKD